MDNCSTLVDRQGEKALFYLETKREQLQVLVQACPALREEAVACVEKNLLACRSLLAVALDKTYSFRAECAGDVERFQEAAKQMGVPLALNLHSHELFFEVQVEITETSADLGKLREVMATYPAGSLFQ